MEHTNEQLEAALDKVQFTVETRKNGVSRALRLLAFAEKHGLDLGQVEIENHKDYRWAGGNNGLGIPPKFIIKQEIGSYSGKGGFTIEKWWAVADGRNAK